MAAATAARPATSCASRATRCTGHGTAATRPRWCSNRIRRRCATAVATPTPCSAPTTTRARFSTCTTSWSNWIRPRSTPSRRAPSPKRKASRRRNSCTAAMMRVRRCRNLGAALGAVAAVLLTAGAATAAENFYQGKTVEIITSSGVGVDSYDTLSRLLARHIGRHLPGEPPVIVRNMPGAGGILAANELYNIAPRDGTVIGMLDQSIYETQLFKVAGLKADVTQMNWIGRIISNNAVLFAWHAAAVKKIEDAYANDLVVSSTGSSSQLRWTMLKRLLGLRLKLVTGYKGTNEGLLAMERGEVEATSMPWTIFRVIRADWLRDRKVNILLQTG